MSRETPERLKQAVEELLLTKGEESTTLRDITELAGANVAAVAYHFKSKDNLMAIVFAEAVVEVTELQSRRILSLPKDHSLEDLIEVWLHPLISPAGPQDREAMLWRIIQRGAAEKAPALLANMTRANSPVEITLSPMLASHLTHLSKEELIFRHNAIIGGLAGLVSGAMGLRLTKEGSNAPPKEFIIAWIIGSLKGQASQ